MERHGDEVHVTDEEARGASTPHIARYILIVSTLLAIVALSAIWITGALTGGRVDEELTAAEMAQSE